ncbi:hypothetical protein F5Y03DRAFT_20725 [Xylaria venustula]|nr:hypothetical protein F5Y03DRAFT_20725 [Xylaria venustula]
MASCPERDFKDPKAMLRHLKHCKLFPEGKFWCPTCQQEDSFKAVSKKKCSWDKVNIARKLFQKSLKAFQSISGHRGGQCYCLCHVSRTETLDNRPMLPSELPIPLRGPPTPTGYGIEFHQLERAASVTKYSELPNNLISELGEMTRKSHYLKSLEAHRTQSYAEAPIPETPCHQISPSELSSASINQSSYSTGISPASASHSNESPVLGNLPPCPENMAISTEPLLLSREASHVTRRGEVPLLTVDTRQSIPIMQPPECLYNMLLDDGETLDHSMGLDGLGMFPFTSIIVPQPDENLQINTPSVPNESLAPYDNMNLHPSPSVSVPSNSNCDSSPSSMSSAPDSLQCHHVNCEFKPTGKAENLRAYLRKHSKKHQKNAIPCEHCDKTFTRQDNLTSHIRKVHSAVTESLFKRRRSNESFRSAGQPRRKESRREAYGTL